MVKTHFVKVRKRGDSGQWRFLQARGYTGNRRIHALRFTEDEARRECEDDARINPDYEFKAVPITANCLTMVLWGRHPEYCDGRPIKIAGGSRSELAKELQSRERQGFTGLCIIAEGEAYPAVQP